MDSLREPVVQRISYARASLWAPFYTVGIAVRIGAYLPEEDLVNSLRKLQILYPPLASRVFVKNDGTAWLTTENVEELTLEVIPWSSENDWADIFLRYEKLPFNFERGPIARFILLQGRQYSDIIAIVPHVLCDGYSMSQVMADLVDLLNVPNRDIFPPVSPPIVSWQNVHHSPFDNLLLRGLVRLINFTWLDHNRVVRQEYYEKCDMGYWQNQDNKICTYQLDPKKTSAIIDNCRRNRTSVTCALVTAFLIARLEQQPGMIKNPCLISIAVNIRDRLINPPGRVLGVYASSFDDRVKVYAKKSFWEMAHLNYVRIHNRINDRQRILLPLVLEEVDPRIIDSLIDGISTGHWTGKTRFLTRFVKINGNSRCIDVSNIGKIEIPGSTPLYPFINMMPFPPLVPGGGIAVNVMTVNGTLNIIVKFRQNELDEPVVRKILNQVENLLMID